MAISPEANPYLTAQKIWDVLLELHSQEQVITRELLRDLTGLRPQIVDDHVGRMIEKGLLRRLRAGVFALEPQYPAARPISVTVLADGCAKGRNRGSLFGPMAQGASHVGRVAGGRCSPTQQHPDRA